MVVGHGDKGGALFGDDADRPKVRQVRPPSPQAEGAPQIKHTRPHKHCLSTCPPVCFRACREPHRHGLAAHVGHQGSLREISTTSTSMFVLLYRNQVRALSGSATDTRPGLHNVLRLGCGGRVRAGARLCVKLPLPRPLLGHRQGVSVALVAREHALHTNFESKLEPHPKGSCHGEVLYLSL